MRNLLVFVAIGIICSTNGLAVQEPHHSDVLDLYAWATTWIVALGAYAGRQERPYRRQDKTPLDDLPDVYIPNELTGNEIEKAFSLAGKNQAVTEANEMLQYLEWVGSVRSNPGGPFLEIKEGYFHPHPQKYQLIRDFFSKTADLDQDMVETIMELVESLRLKTKFDDWDDMSSEVDGIWQEIISKALEKSYVKQTDEGHYSLTKTITDMTKKLVNDTIMKRERWFRLRGNEDDFEAVQEWEKFEANVDNAIGAATTIVQLPRDLTWPGIKSAVQAMYKRAIPQVHLFQFLTKKIEYLTLDGSVGLSKLSPFITQKLVDSLYWTFPTPLRQRG